ncbi:MGMT family protein [Candidatus Parcubacteria bacterium]|nr:MAG: MGMT family protein [Candidatus Parcubacteria bacterium]
MKASISRKVQLVRECNCSCGFLKRFKEKKKAPFRARVLAVVRSIPKGQVLSYKEVARRAGNPRAARAVGSILHRNFNPRIPCHRVVRADGGLGGYNRGIAKKHALLRKEGVPLPCPDKKRR